MENADFTAYVKSVSAQGYAIVDYDNAVLYNDTTDDDVTTAASQLYYAPPVMRKPQSFSKSIPISRTFDLDGIEVTISGSISNMTVAYDLDYDLGGLNSFYLDVSADTDVKTVIKSELKTTSSREVNLARIPAFCTGILNVDLLVTATVSLSGETTLSYG